MKQKLLKTMLLLSALVVGLGNAWADSWERVTSVSTLTSGGTFIIGYEATANSGVIIPMANSGSATTSTAGYMYSGSTATSGGTGTINMAEVVTTSSFEVEIGASSEVDGAIYIKIGDNYLGNTNSKNNCKLFADEATTTSFTPSFGSNDNVTLDIAANTSGSAYRYLKYNTGSPRFAVYATTPDKIVIYKKVTGSTTYSVTYDGNGNTSGTVPTDASNPYTSGATVTVLGNTGSLAKTNYIFSGWNTKADGTGTNYDEDDTFEITANTTLYAKWVDTRTETLVDIDESGITNTNKYVSTDAGSFAAKVYDDNVDEIVGAAVSWSSSDGSVATINASSGVVTLVGAGTTTITASYAGNASYKPSSETYELTVTNQDPSLVEIWSEDFSGYSANDVPDGGTYSYVCVDGNSDTKIYENANAGGESPELLINKQNTSTSVNGSFSATIPLNNGYAGTLKLQFKNNNAINVSVTDNTSAVLKSSTEVSANTTTGNTIEISGVTAETTSVTILWSNSSSSNVRIDDIVLKGKEAPARPTFSEAAKIFSSSFDMTISSAAGTTLKYTTDGTNPAVSGTATSVASNSKTITISGSSDVTVKAIAIKDEVVSAVASVTYTYDSRPAPTFTLSDTEMTIYVLSEDETITLTTNSDGTVTFESSDDSSLEVDNTADSKVGVLSAYVAGDYTVTVRTAATVNYLAGEGSVTVHVIKLPTTITTTASFANTDLKDASSGSFTGVAKYNDVAIVGAEVTYSSSNTKVATIDSDGNVTYLKAGTTRLTASYEGDDEYAACEAYYDLTLTDSRPQETEVDITLNNTFFGCSAFSSWTTGMATSLSGLSKNVTVTYSKGSSANMYCNEEKVRFYTGNTFTIEAPDAYHIISVDMNATITSASPEGTISSDTWTGDAASVSFTFANKTDLTSISVVLAPAVTVTTAGYATYASNHALNFTGKTIKAYIAITKGDGTGVTFTQINKVPANTGILLYKDGGTTEAIPVFDPEKVDADATTGNKFVRGTGAAVATDGSTVWNYILNNVGGNIGFYKAAGQTVAKNRAYISILKSESAAIKEFITLDFSENADGIKTMDNSQQTTDGAIYNLAGQRISKMQKGINIVNGKKVLF